MLLDAVPGEWIGGGVILLRLLLPLSILRYPLPGMLLSAFAIDAIDRDIHVLFLDLTDMQYQRYDKALDAYYMSFAYLAMIRSWPSGVAFRIGRILFYYRLLGIVAFEITGLRWLFPIFPNAFDFFFVFHEGVRVLWRPEWMNPRTWLSAALAIGVVTTLKEMWVHVALIDTSDFVKERLVRAPAEMGWTEVLTENPWLVPVAAGLVALTLLGGRAALRRLPPGGRTGGRIGSMTGDRTGGLPGDRMGDGKGLAAFDIDARLGAPAELLAGTPLSPGRLRSPPLVEQAVFLSLVLTIFTQALEPGTHASASLVLGGLGLVIVNALIAGWRARHGRRWRTVPVEMAWRMGPGLALVGMGILGGALAGTWLHPQHAAVFLLLAPFLVTFHDQSVALRGERFGPPSVDDAGIPSRPRGQAASSP